MAGIYLGNHVSEYVKRAGIGKKGGCLLFRYSMATRMLENGADSRYIQQMLGQSDILTTRLYTHVSIGRFTFQRKAERGPCPDPSGGAGDGLNY